MEEHAKEKEEKEKEDKADIKSNNPHLTGGEKRVGSKNTTSI